MTIKVITDSTSYIPHHLIKKFNISVVSLSVSFESETYYENEIDNILFYEKMSKSQQIPTSSQPTLHDLYQFFEQHVLANKAIVGIFISSAMSGTYSTALKAKEMIMEKFPKAVIEIVDSKSNCMELGFAVLAAAKAVKAGKSIQEVLTETHKVIARSRFLFVPETLEYLKKGGRIGGAAAFLGSFLQIKPILTVTNGKTDSFGKVRTKVRAIKKIINVFLTDIQQKGLGEIVIHHINNEAEGEEIAKTLEDKLHQPVPVYSIGPVIGLHVGPGTTGIVYYTEKK